MRHQVVVRVYALRVRQSVERICLMQFGQAGLTITVSTRRDICQEALDQASMALFALFQARETEFGFNSNIVVDFDPEG